MTSHTRIIGSQAFQKRVVRCLDMIKPTPSYRYVKQLARIEEHGDLGRHIHGRCWTRTCALSSYGLKHDDVEVASTIVHEGAHAAHGVSEKWPRLAEAEFQHAIGYEHRARQSVQLAEAAPAKAACASGDLMIRLILILSVLAAGAYALANVDAIDAWLMANGI